MRRTALCLLVISLSGVQAAEPDARAKARIEKIEQALPKAERAADECEKALAAFADSKDDIVQAAVDGARLRIVALRSLRQIIAQQPEFFSYHIGESSPAQWQEAFEFFLSCAKSGNDPFKGATSGVRTVRSPIDGQLLFYVFRLPKDYDGTKRYPLDVALHAGAGLTWQADWIDGKPSTDPAKAEKSQRIWMSPCGRGNNSYAGMGEVAVMAAIRDIQKRYAVDVDRVVIGGASMGGTGGFRLAALHPDVFAAAHALTGGANYAVPVGNGRFDATLLIDNFCNTGLCIWDAPKEGWYKQNHEFADGLRTRAQKFPGSYPNLELTDPDGGHGVIERQLQAEGWDWLRQQVRKPYPQRVVYKTYCLRYPGAYWARIDTVEDPGQPARIEVELNDGGKLTAKLENCDRFTLDLAKDLVGQAEQIEVRVNSGAPFPAATGKPVHFVRAGDGWRVAAERSPPGLVKKHGLSGPVQDVFMAEPVLLVHGTLQQRAATEVEQSLDAAVTQLFGRGDGAGTLHTSFPRKADRDVTEADIAAKNLVLLGSPAQNSLVRKIAGKLPVKFLDDGVEAAGKSYRGPEVGLVMVYPNPLNPERYVLLLPEGYAGGSPLTLPDYLVVKTVKSPKGAAQQVLAQGLFDARWQLKP